MLRSKIMTTNNKYNETFAIEGVTSSGSPINGNDQSDTDNLENPVSAESPTLPTEPTTPVEADPLEGFNPDVFKGGLEGDERYRILDLYLGYLAGQKTDYETIKTRSVLTEWDKSNRPPLGIAAIHAYVKANYTRWLRYHYLHHTGTWAGRKISK
jgi:hypothetical protein